MAAAAAAIPALVKILGQVGAKLLVHTSLANNAAVKKAINAALGGEAKAVGSVSNVTKSQAAKLLNTVSSSLPKGGRVVAVKVASTAKSGGKGG
jgi:hypothetical protein